MVAIVLFTHRATVDTYSERCVLTCYLVEYYRTICCRTSLVSERARLPLSLFPLLIHHRSIHYMCVGTYFGRLPENIELVAAGR